MIRHLGPKDYRVVPWANGRGQTVEMLRIDGPGGLLFRLSRAQVVEDGPFSILPGIERNLTVVSGPGFGLTGPGGSWRCDPFVPVRFAGDLTLAATGVEAPSDDVNVMWARGLVAPEVTVLTPGAVADPGPGLVALYHPVSAALTLSDAPLTNAGGAPVLSVRITAPELLAALRS